MHGLTSLYQLVSGVEKRARTMKVALLVAVLEVDGPVAFTVKKGPFLGTESAFLSLIVGDPDGGIVKITAWRETAEKWGGNDGEPIRKGDIVYFKGVYLNM